MFAQISQQVQSTFWDLCIAFLGKAEWLKWPIAFILAIKKDTSLKTKLVAAIIIACIGFSFGILVYFITLLF
jgi:hypothetical protein